MFYWICCVLSRKFTYNTANYSGDPLHSTRSPTNVHPPPAPNLSVLCYFVAVVAPAPAQSKELVRGPPELVQHFRL
jgi:hypothetical protein